MQFKNWSVSQKIWVLLFGVLALTLAAGFGMTTYIGRVEAQVRSEIQNYESRIRLAVQWRGVTDLAIANVVLGAMSSEDEVSRYAAGKVQQGGEGPQPCSSSNRC